MWLIESVCIKTKYKVKIVLELSLLILAIFVKLYNDRDYSIWFCLQFGIELQRSYVLLANSLNY